MERISSDIISPEEFFSKYIRKRQPCIISNHLRDETWHGARWTNDYLRQVAGTCTVKVETREEKGKFGIGCETELPFRDVIDAIASGDENLYMTTQKLLYSPEGQPAIVSPPLTYMTSDFPYRPAMMGNLIPQNINLWFGSTSSYSSSGLHHDYHDNLYIVLRGTKKFTLFPFSLAHCMYTVGEVAKVHTNGRINYAGKPTNADGSDISAEKALRASLLLEAAANRGGSDASDDDDVEAALDDLLDAQIENQFSEEDESSSDDEYDDITVPWQTMERPKKRPAELISQNVVKKGKVCTRFDEDKADYDEAALDSDSPLNFSRVDLSLSMKQLKKEFPLFYEVYDRRVEIELNAGEMLYLPAGWFHEVKSLGSAPDGHLAMNYWFHPPDGESYEKPYTSDFWKLDWVSRSLC